MGPSNSKRYASTTADWSNDNENTFHLSVSSGAVLTDRSGADVSPGNTDHRRRLRAPRRLHRPLDVARLEGPGVIDASDFSAYRLLEP
jgi:hypothetical protein